MKRLTCFMARGLSLTALSIAFVPDIAIGSLKVWDVGDYVQDGIVAHYDAIRNVGAALPHDNAAATWADLSPMGGSAANQSCTYAGTGSWISNAYVFAGTSCMKLQNTLTLGNAFTIQIASDIDMTADSRTRPVLFSSNSDNFQMIVDRSYAAVSNSMSLSFRTTAYSGITQGNSPFVNWESGRYVNAAFGDSKAYFTAGTAWPSGKAFVNADVSLPALTYTFGGRQVGGTSGERNYCSIGKFHALRIYSRKLTDVELAWNRAIDEIRYRGSTVLPVTNVVVVADALCRCGVEAPGAYAVDATHSFAATNVTVGGCVYAPVGYAVEKWNVEDGTWGEAVVHEGATYAYSTNDCPSTVRLSWRWEMVSGIARYDVGDYVQDGIVAHYDAIRNVGAALPHDNAAATWADLSPMGGSAANQSCTYAGTGSWISNAYVFAGTSCMKLQNTLTLGNAFTIQIASDIDMTADSRTRPVLFSSNSDNFQMIVDRSYAAVSNSMSLSFRTTAYSGITQGNSPFVNWESGRYVNAAFGDSKAYFTAGTAWPSGKAFVNADVSLPALTYTFGGRYVGGTSGERNYCSIGKFHALRIYSRKLTDAELAWNRDVDEVRYRGAEATASNAVWVTTSKRTCYAAESGAYRLKGEYTFTADVVTVGETVYTPVGSIVEMWNAATGAWGNPVYAAGASRTLRQSDASVARRLTWQYRSNKGTLVIMM